MRKIPLLCCIMLLCVLASAHALAADPAFVFVPDVIRPGKYYDIIVSVPYSGNASLSLLDEAGGTVFEIFTDYPVSEGNNTLSWDGTRPDLNVTGQGDYSIRLTMDNGTLADTALRIGAPYPMLTRLVQSDSVLSANAIEVSFYASEPGVLLLTLKSLADTTLSPLTEMDVAAGGGSCQWNGQLDGVRVPEGRYALILTLRTENGYESVSQYIYVDVEAQPATSQGVVITDITPSPTPQPTPTPAPTPPPVSAPYSNADDGTFWSMTPGETDDALIWEILTQPIVVYDDGKLGATGHAYLMEKPDGTGAKVAQLHAKSQGLHILEAENEYGYVLVEAFSNYNPDFKPVTDEEKAHAFDVKQGYVKASNLKTVEVQQDIAILIDKLTQRLFIYIDGVRVTELLIATGKIADEKYYNETIPGEYITISHTGGFPSGNMYCDMAIRINGGILIHEVPYKENADGTKNYSAFEGYLGTKQSHGCIRVQRLKNGEGYNHRWLWDTLKRGAPYKVVIWDDLGRADTPDTWYPNP